MKKMLFYSICVATITLITIFVIYLSEKDYGKNIEFLNSYGWKVSEEPIEIKDVNIPMEFDEIYNNYNQLQLQAGLDLSKYKGQKGTRYTYEVLNYPIDVSEQIRANVICIKNKPIAGDIMTISLNGFMHSLNFPSEYLSENEKCSVEEKF